VAESSSEGLDRRQDAFYVRHPANLRSLDARAYELAAANRRLIRRREHAAEVEPDEGEVAPTEAEEEQPQAEPQPPEPALVERVLVAQVPRAESRWGQVGLNEA
jgi:hypothetical protein